MDKFDSKVKNDEKNTKVGCGCSIIILLFILLLFSFTTIKSGEVGLKTRFGKIVDTSLTEGVNWKIPFIEKIVKVNIKVQKAEMNIESSTKDLQTVNTAVAVNYRVNGDKASALYKKVGNKYEETVLQPAIKESIKSEDLNLTDFSFSQEYTKAIEEKQVAEQNLEKAKLEAEKKITEAKGEAEANALKQQTITDKVLQEKFIEKWDGKLSIVSGNANGFFDLDSILKDKK